MKIDIPVSLPLWIVSQVFGAVALVAVIIAFQKKKRVSTLLLIAFANGISAVMHGFLTNWAMAGFTLAVTTRALIYAWMESRRQGTEAHEEAVASGKRYKVMRNWKVLPVWFEYTVLVAMLLLNLVALVITDKIHWFDYVLLGGMFFATYGGWAKGVHWIRLANIVMSSLIIINAVMFANLLSIITESFVIAAILLFYVRKSLIK